MPIIEPNDEPKPEQYRRIPNKQTNKQKLLKSSSHKREYSAQNLDGLGKMYS